MGPRKVLFYRDFGRYTGGHFRLWQYYNHVRSTSSCHPYIFFSDRTRWDTTNPWLPVRQEVLSSWAEIHPDLLVLAGIDWKILSLREREHPTIPVINPILSIRHANPSEQRYKYLKHKAIRTCATDEVRDALLDSGQVNGPVYIVPAGLDTQPLPTPRTAAEKDLALVIAATKNPALGRKLKRRLERAEIRTELLVRSQPRGKYLEQINRARAAVLLPMPEEGSYTPPIEAMALSTIPIVPYCRGCRHYQHGLNCLRSEYTVDSLERAVKQVFAMDPSERERLLANGRATVGRLSLAVERKAFLDIVENVDQIW